MIASSFSQAKGLYERSVVLSQTWLSKYYPELNKEFFGVKIEDVQAFSQHFFFSCLLAGKGIDSVWSQYPLSTQKKRSNLSKFSLPKKTLKIAVTLIGAVEKLEVPGKHQVVFLANGRHLEDQFELVSYLSKKYKILVVCKIPPDICDKLKKNRINFINVTSGQKYLSRGKRFGNLWSFINAKNEKGGNKLFENELWGKRLWYLRLEQFPDIAALLELAKRILSEAEPQILLTTSSNDVFGAAFCTVARKMKIPVAEIQHGYINRGVEPRFYKADYELVWGNLSKKFLEGNDFKVVTVGSSILKRPKNASNAPRSGKTRLLVLLAPINGVVSAFKAEDNRKVIPSLIGGLEKLPNDYEVSLRCHPSYDLEGDLVGIKLKSNITIDRGRDIISAVKNSDVVITQPTTAGFIAALYNKPLLFFDSSWLTEKNGDPIRDSKSALEIPLREIGNADKYITGLIKDEKALSEQKRAQNKLVADYCSCFGEESFKMISYFLKRAVKDEKPS